MSSKLTHHAKDQILSKHLTDMYLGKHLLFQQLNYILHNVDFVNIESKQFYDEITLTEKYLVNIIFFGNKPPSYKNNIRYRINEHVDLELLVNSEIMSKNIDDFIEYFEEQLDKLIYIVNTGDIAHTLYVK